MSTSKRFTRKSYATQDRKGLQQLHRLLSRIDVEKDGISANPAISAENLPYFHEIANKLFGELLVTSYKKLDIDIISVRDSLKKSTDYFLDILKQYDVYKPHQFTSVWNYTDLQQNWSVIAPEITEGIHDSGLSPHAFSESLKVVLNPGSYLDPGSRTAITECEEIVGFYEVMKADTFQDLGIPGIVGLESTLHSDGSADIDINYNLIKLHTHFSSNYKQLAGEPYFMGNSTKNTWFNTNTLKETNKASLYILCKELGDTIQAVYTQLRNNYNLHRYKTCFFTNDTNATYRCILLHVPACVTKSTNGCKRLYQFHPAMEDVKTKWQTLQLEALVDHNQQVINSINTVLNKRYYFLQNGRCIHFSKTSQIAEFLQKCIESIRKETNRFKSIPRGDISLSTYSRLASGFKASRLFNQQVVNQSVHQLFIKPTSASPLFPDYFGDLLYSGTHVGGSETEIETTLQYKQNPKIPDYTIIDPTIPDKYMPAIYVLHELYTVIKNKYTERSEISWRFLTEDIHGKLIQFFSWAGFSLETPRFLESVVDAYDSGIFQQMSHADFAFFAAPFLAEVETDENDWEWKLFEAQVDHPRIEPYISMLEADVSKPILQQNSLRLPTLIKARRTRKVRRSKPI